MKPIETTFDGYRFRSRLEARWAVFFNKLDIQYRYEPEGFDLGGIWYLPDFWLPQLDCWVEIKATLPTEEEEEKARLLAWHSQKEVYLFHGDVWHGVAAQGFSKIQIFVTPRRDKAANPVEVPVPLDLALLLMEAELLDLSFSLDPQDKQVYIAQQQLAFDHLFFPASPSDALHKVTQCIQLFERQRQALPPLIEQVEQRKHELFAYVAAVHPFDTLLTVRVYGRVAGYVYEWIVCRHCGKAHIHNEHLLHHNCSCFGDDCQGDEERLHAAYIAARQVRFEKRK